MAAQPSRPPSASAPQPVLLYDGECGLCNAAVRLLLRLDRRARLRFAPLQGNNAQTYLCSSGLPSRDFDSMIFVPDWVRRAEVPPLFRTNAALAALRAMGGIWRSASVLRIIPASVRDAFYRVIARFRYRLFGPYRPRPLARPEWERRFLR